MATSSFKIKYEISYSADIIVGGVSAKDALEILNQYWDNGSLLTDLKPQLYSDFVEFKIGKINLTDQKPELTTENEDWEHFENCFGEIMRRQKKK